MLSPVRYRTSNWSMSNVPYDMCPCKYSSHAPGLRLMTKKILAGWRRWRSRTINTRSLPSASLSFDAFEFRVVSDSFRFSSTQRMSSFSYTRQSMQASQHNGDVYFHSQSLYVTKAPSLSACRSPFNRHGNSLMNVEEVQPLADNTDSAVYTLEPASNL